MQYYHWSLDAFLGEQTLPLFTTAVEPGVHPARSFHDHEKAIELVIVASGTAKHLVPPFSIPINPGDVLLLPPGVIHAYDECATLGLSNIVFDPQRLILPGLDTYTLPLFAAFLGQKDERPPEMLPYPIMHLPSELLWETQEIFERLHTELKGRRPGKQFYSVALLMEMLLKLARFDHGKTAQYRPPFQVGSAVEFMRQHLSEKFSMEKVAKITGLSRRNLFRHFQQSLGCSPLDYLNRLRLQQAAEMLLQSQLSLADIAFQCGFCDSNYFSKQFIKVYSISPFRFRKKHVDKTDEK